MRALASTIRLARRPSQQSLPSWLTWTLVIGAGVAGGALSVVVGELISSGALHDLIVGWQTAGTEMGGAFNGVSHGEIEIMKRGAAIALRALV